MEESGPSTLIWGTSRQSGDLTVAPSTYPVLVPFKDVSYMHLCVTSCSVVTHFLFISPYSLFLTVHFSVAVGDILINTVHESYQIE